MGIIKAQLEVSGQPYGLILGIVKEQFIGNIEEQDKNKLEVSIVPKESEE